MFFHDSERCSFWLKSLCYFKMSVIFLSPQRCKNIAFPNKAIFPAEKLLIKSVTWRTWYNDSPHSSNYLNVLRLDIYLSKLNPEVLGRLRISRIPEVAGSQFKTKSRKTPDNQQTKNVGDDISQISILWKYYTFWNITNHSFRQQKQKMFYTI